jgi:hypothetical protein
VSGKVRVTIVVEYEPDPASYTYPEGVEDLTLAEMVRQDADVFVTGGVAVEDLIEWGDTVNVRFEPVEEGARR